MKSRFAVIQSEIRLKTEAIERSKLRKRFDTEPSMRCLASTNKEKLGVPKMTEVDGYWRKLLGVSKVSDLNHPSLARFGREVKREYTTIDSSGLTTGQVVEWFRTVCSKTAKRKAAGPD
uniref:Transposase n=1 Tax=Steinernema glaseri TaxID=37863 RepID=A0A1I7YKY8_9BILA